MKKKVYKLSGSMKMPFQPTREKYDRMIAEFKKKEDEKSKKKKDSEKKGPATQ